MSIVFTTITFTTVTFGNGAITHNPLCGEGIGFVSCTLLFGDLVGQTAQVLNQHNAQRNGHCPQLANG